MIKRRYILYSINNNKWIKIVISIVMKITVIITINRKSTYLRYLKFRVHSWAPYVSFSFF